MQLEIILHNNEHHVRSQDLGFLLHKHPDHMHERDLSWGKAYIFFPEIEETYAKAVLYLDIDPIGLVRGRSAHGQALLAQYVNDRPFTANSFLSVAIAKSFGQSMAGKSKERQDLADQKLLFEARIVPLSVSGSKQIVHDLFEPLGYEISLEPINKISSDAERNLFDLSIKSETSLEELLNHLYILIPVLDNTKHYFVGHDEVENLLLKGQGWLEKHPQKELVIQRALKYRKGLTNIALSRLAEIENEEQDIDQEINEHKDKAEETLEKPIRLHDLRLDAVAEKLKSLNVRSVIDLGCGEGKLLKRLIKEKNFEHIVGVDASISTLERAAEKLYLKNASENIRKRISLMQGSVTYADKRWQGFEAATLVEVIEHIDQSRLSALERSVFGVAEPDIVIITTPNREYNALFENMPKDKFRHPDHRFEWTRAEFQAWAKCITEKYNYTVTIDALGPEDETHGAPSQMGVFTR